MLAWFDANDLPNPPVPERFCARIAEVAPTTWATTNADPLALYLFDWTGDELAAQGDDNFAVSYGGHGVNSYAITLQVAVPGLTLAVQEHWGGVYTNPETAASQVAAMFEAAATCLSAASAHQLGRQRGILASRFRESFFAGWLTDLGSTRNFLQDEPPSWETLPDLLAQISAQ